MYCRRCYAPLASQGERCDKCGRKFDPADARTFLHRPFPRGRKILMQIIGTTLVGAGVAFVIAIQQMGDQAAQWSGH
jgi:hypothetical protein